MKKILLITPHPRGAKHPFLGRLPLTRAACVLALSEQREAEKPDPEKARKYCGCSSDFCAEDLREWTKRSMTEKTRKQRSEMDRKTTRTSARKYRADNLCFCKAMMRERIRHP